jgi:hypothetical protein
MKFDEITTIKIETSETSEVISTTSEKPKIEIMEKSLNNKSEDEILDELIKEVFDNNPTKMEAMKHQNTSKISDPSLKTVVDLNETGSLTNSSSSSDNRKPSVIETKPTTTMTLSEADVV